MNQCMIIVADDCKYIFGISLIQNNDNQLEGNSCDLLNLVMPNKHLKTVYPEEKKIGN